MKGIVFTEFIDMVDAKFGPKVTESIIDGADLPTKGAYTAVGTYDHNELIRLVVQLSAATSIEVSDLVRTFGRHLFGRFVTVYPQFFRGVDSAFSFLEHIEDYIHVEVRKLYPDAELPTFEVNITDDERMELIYKSNRPFGDFAEGLIMGCIEHFDEPIEIDRKNLSPDKGTSIVRFSLTHKVAVLQ